MPFLEFASLETEVTRKEPNNKQLVVLIFGFTIPIVATAHLLSFWLSKAFAWAISIFVWYLVIVWIPPKPKMNRWYWLIIVAVLSVAIYFLVALQILPS